MELTLRLIVFVILAMGCLAQAANSKVDGTLVFVNDKICAKLGESIAGDLEKHDNVKSEKAMDVVNALLLLCKVHAYSRLQEPTETTTTKPLSTIVTTSSTTKPPGVSLSISEVVAKPVSTSGTEKLDKKNDAKERHSVWAPRRLGRQEMFGLIAVGILFILWACIFLLLKMSKTNSQKSLKLPTRAVYQPDQFVLVNTFHIL